MLPAYKLPPIPTPPATVNAPVAVLVALVASNMLCVPPYVLGPATPIPPLTTRAPLLG